MKGLPGPTPDSMADDPRSGAPGSSLTRLDETSIGPPRSEPPRPVDPERGIPGSDTDAAEFIAEAASPRFVPYDTFSIYLHGRYYATLSMLPWLVLMMLLFFGAAFLLVMMFLQDPFQSFRITLMPLLMGVAVLSPLLVIILFMIRWHGKRRLDFTEEGVSLVAPNGRAIFVPWQHLHAVELRFNMPKLVTCTLVTPITNFSFTNLEFNLEGRVPLDKISEKGFDLVKLRDFLYYLHRVAPKLQWRLGESFQQRFKVYYPPYDLEKMK
ncbi:hypothetical protein SCOR_16720 [Sulfidibacter corallicola]|uniref:Transmembrane protein n=1 Tax=Sulfidibacter corallicola TaxID=2818388 RepID=A0A8A4U573_SULCO|nr:hypothetical protein [Sulfidibacter corallicola]QTD53895.1 hypothetical protein J3U87_15715 [Sulfidibacter corallicola]